LIQNEPKDQGGEFPVRSFRLSGTNPRPRHKSYQIMDRSYPAWLWIRKAPLRLTNREFKAAVALFTVGLPFFRIKMLSEHLKCSLKILNSLIIYL